MTRLARPAKPLDQAGSGSGPASAILRRYPRPPSVWPPCNGSGLTFCCAFSTGFALARPFCWTDQVTAEGDRCRRAARAWGPGASDDSVRMPASPACGHLPRAGTAQVGWGRSAAIFSAPRSVRSWWFRQPDRADLDHAGAARHRPDDQSGPEHLRLRRHHRPDRSAAVLIIAPIALMIAVAHVLNKLGNDSELIVMNAAGMSPWLLFRPFLAVGDRGLAPGGRDQRLCLARRACASCGAGRPRCAPTSSPTSCSPAASPRSSAG